MGNCFGRLFAADGEDGVVQATSTSDSRSHRNSGHHRHHRSQRNRDAQQQGLSDGDDDVPLLSGSGQDDPAALANDRQRRHRHRRNQQRRSSSDRQSAASGGSSSSSGHLQYFQTASGPSSSAAMESEIRLAQRVGLIQQLPLIRYDEERKQIARECVICMVEFDNGDMLRCLPCLHIYHEHCIDQWLLKSLTCPSCMEPVDAALLATFATGWSS